MAFVQKQANRVRFHRLTRHHKMNHRHRRVRTVLKIISSNVNCKDDALKTQPFFFTIVIEFNAVKFSIEILNFKTSGSLENLPWCVWTTKFARNQRFTNTFCSVVSLMNFSFEVPFLFVIVVQDFFFCSIDWYKKVCVKYIYWKLRHNLYNLFKVFHL